MENLLKNQFCNSTLIQCEFERDFMNKPGNLEDIHTTIVGYVNEMRDMLANYIFGYYDSDEEVIQDLIDMHEDLGLDCDSYYETEFYPYLNSLYDIVDESLESILNSIINDL